MSGAGKGSCASGPLTPDREPGRMQMRYGFNEVDGWWYASRGPDRDLIRRRLRLMQTEVVRIFAFDKPVPDPISEWINFAAQIRAILAAGAVPMVTFAKFHPPHDDPRALRSFAERCEEVAWGCLEEWGGEACAGWLWCIWNEPNNYQVGGALTFDRYRIIYEEVAERLYRLLAPHLDGRKIRIGGPAACGFQPYWSDWIARFLSEVEDRLVGFVSWHHYGDWRPVVPSTSLEFDIKGDPEAPSGAAYRALLMAQTPQYEARARTVSRLIAGRDVLNVCGELNTIVNHDLTFVGGLNVNAFGAAYYASALIHLIRGGADLEMRWTATSSDHDAYRDAYGLIGMNGEATPAALAKQLFAQNVRRGDCIRFPGSPAVPPNVDAITATDENGRQNLVLVNTAEREGRSRSAHCAPALARCRELLVLDESTGGQIERRPCDGNARIQGYGLAVASNRPDAMVID